MFNKLIKVAAGCALLVLSTANAADQAAPPAPMEYELVNDFAARLQVHLQQTAKILEQLRQTTDPAERKKLMNAYLTAIGTAARITHTMQQMLDGGMGMGMAKRKMGGMMKDGKCGMMGERKAGKSGSGAGKPEAADDDEAAEPEGGGEKPEDEHAGHH